uniref:tetratricopeptide repeat protein n=1 Tax=uncultured Paraglaciecola sp. TaxID=1765024 RepID=UPI002624B190
WLTKAAIIIPFVIGLGWSVKDVLFPASTQQLIERQLAEANKIAISPFENISGDPLIQLFGDGLAVNLGSDLAAIAAEQNNTWIVPATEISRMKDQSLKAVADKYGVNLVLTGSIQHMGSTRLLVLNLLNAVTGQQVKTAEVSIQADELFQGHGLIRTQALELLDWSVPKDVTEKFNAERPQLDGAYREYIRGRGYLYRDDQQGNLLNSIKAFDRSISIDANYQLAYVGLAEAQYRLYTESKDISWLKSMENTVNELKIINKDHSKLAYLFAQIVFERGDYSQSVVFFSQSIKRNPQHIESFLGLALAHEKLNEFDKAEKIYKHAKSASPNNMLVISYFGVYYFILGEYERAVEQFKEQIELAPNNHWAYLNMAASYYSLGKIDEAIKFTEVAIDINPSADSYSNLGTMYFYQSDFHKSVETFEKMISLNDTDFINWGNLADAYQYSNNEKSLEAYMQAAELATQSLLVNPKDTMAIAAKSYYLANLNQKI